MSIYIYFDVSPKNVRHQLMTYDHKGLMSFLLVTPPPIQMHKLSTLHDPLSIRKYIIVIYQYFPQCYDVCEIVCL